MPKSLPIFQPDRSDPLPLDDIRVASPCPAEWADMVGSDKVRFCASCQKNVYNLSGMRRDEAIDLLRATEGRVCVRFFRRADGTVLTEDCPVGVAAALRRAKRATLAAAAISLGAVASMLAMAAGLFGPGARKACERVEEVKAVIETKIDEVPVPDPLPPPMMGEPAPMPEEIMGKPSMPREVKGDVGPSLHEIKGTMKRAN